MRPTFENQWRERFTEFAELRDDEAGIAGWSATGLEARVRRFLSLFSPERPDALWLDAGCGAGTYMRILVAHGQRVVGVDYSLSALRKRSAESRLAGPVAVADVRALPFVEGRFDGVLCLGVLQALTDSRAAALELTRQLSPGGELWIDALNADFVVHFLERAQRRVRRRDAHLRHESPAKMRQVLREAGLVDIKIYWMPIAPQRHRWLQRMFDAASFRRIAAALPLAGRLVSHAFIVHARRPRADAMPAAGTHSRQDAATAAG